MRYRGIDVSDGGVQFHRVELDDGSQALVTLGHEGDAPEDVAACIAAAAEEGDNDDG